MKQSWRDHLGKVSAALARGSSGEARDAWATYALAVACVGAAALGRVVLGAWGEARLPATLFYLAVMVAAVSGGWGPGVLAVCLSAGTLSIWSTRPWPGGFEALVVHGGFVLVGLSIVALCEGLRRWRGKADEALRQVAAADRAAREERDRLTLIADSLPVLLSYIDRDRRYRFNNRAYEEWFGLSRTEILGRTMPEVLGEDAYEKLRPAVEAALAGRTVNAELRVPYRAVGSRDVAITYVPHRVGEAGEVRGFAVLVADISERRMGEEALRRSDERFRLASRATTGVIYEWEVEQDRVYRSEGLEGLLGFRPQEAAPTNAWWTSRIHGDDLPRYREAFERAMASPSPHFEAEYRMRHADGRWVDVWDRSHGVKDASGKLVRVVGSTVDVTAWRAAERGLRESAERLKALLESERHARAEAERLGRLKDQFLATLSHELRTPMNAILGWAQLLRGGLPAEEQGQALETIERNARLQTQLIDDLLDMSRIISGKMRLETAELDLRGVVEAAAASVRPTADARGVALDLRPAPEDDGAPPPRVRGDAGRLQQVAWNLLSNAIKFTPAGGRVEVTVEARDGRAHLEVKDTGAGIAPEFLPHVFERFRQADGSTTRRHGGLGLGLSIVRSVVELHGGTVAAHSEGTGRGATFSVELPLAPAAEPGAAPPPEVTSLEGLRVLVVDDERDGREVVRRMLEEHGARVATASSAAEALTALRAEPPDVLLSDIGMPDEDGYALLRRVRALPPEHGGDVPAVALTAFVRAEDRAEALGAGFARHVGKPVDAAELLSAVAAAARTGPAAAKTAT